MWCTIHQGSHDLLHTHVTHFMDVTTFNAHQAPPHNLSPMQLQGFDDDTTSDEFDADSDELLDTDIELVLSVMEELTEELIREGSQMIINGLWIVVYQLQ